MWFSFGAILITAAVAQAQITTNTRCVCVHYKLCSTNNTIIRDGSSYLGERFDPSEYEECTCPSERRPEGQQCANSMLVCCHEPGDTPEVTTPTEVITTEEPEEVLTWDNCGVRGFNLPRLLNRVINNEDNSATFSNEFPWMAMLLSKKDNSMICGGSILHHHVVMTAAHCVKKFQAPDLLVWVGIWNTNIPSGSEKVEVERILRHEQFNPNNYRNDIALLVLKQGIPRSETIGPICLPEANTQYDNMLCIATGWGTSYYGQRNLSDTLRKVELRTVPHAKCQEELRKTRLSPYFELHNSFVCAKGEMIEENKYADTCTGDGGSPLICQMPNSNKYLQLGIVAVGLECGRNIPALYTNVPLLKPWIDQQFDERNLRNLQN